MRLRVRSRSGVQNLTVDPTVSLAALKAQLDASQLRSGFPPRPLDAPDATPLSDLLRDGDLIVVQNEASVPAPTSAPTSAPTLVPASAPTPVRAPASANTTATSGPPSSSIASQGRFFVREVPDDNSCLFRSVAHVLDKGSTPATLRRTIATCILSSPAEYTAAVLGREPDAYARWIGTDAAWGGAIELSILARDARVQLAAFDVHTMRLDRYPHDSGFSTVAYLVYDGIHYNYVALAVPAVGDVTQFDPADTHVLHQVRKLAQNLHDTRQFTDTASFALVCADCGQRLKGEKEALQHANSTGHANFREK